MNIPDSALTFIRMQRTHYEKNLPDRNLRMQYEDDIEGEYRSIRAYLPVNCAAIWDIGCGVGGIDVFLYHHYQGVLLFLTDFDEISPKLYYGFKQKAAHYNSLSETRDLLSANGVPTSSMKFIPVMGNPDRKVDLVVSLYSWGYHYPVEEYINRVYSQLSHGGKLVLDVRANTSGVSVLESYFGKNSLYVNPTFNKRNRVIAVKGENFS